MDPAGISVIICTYNGSGRITPVLDALCRQDIPLGLAWEIIIVDNGSTDGTSELIRQYWKDHDPGIPYRVVTEPKQGKANALLTGYNEAAYELMLLCDDDNWLQPGYLSTVLEIYREHPEIGLLGGYGRAVFNPGEKPGWFDAWENYFVCGKHHEKNGFLKPLDYSIWGAGSVLRKTMWQFLRSRGFRFINSMQAGKAMTEDVELSQAITFTGHRLYFDEKLWFFHDLRGKRISLGKLFKQQSLNGQNGATLNICFMAYYHGMNPGFRFTRGFIDQLVGLTASLFIRPKFNKLVPDDIYILSSIMELLLHPRRYRAMFKESSKWVNGIKNTFPLSDNPLEWNAFS